MYKKYTWYKVFYKVFSSYARKQYVTFEYAINNVEEVIKKHGENFIKVEEWTV